MWAGTPNGIWNTAPEQIFALCEVMQREGVQMHIHVNGDEASEVSLNALETAIRKHPWQGHRHVLQHCQMMGVDQFRRSADLGVCVNIFANHIWYFGDQHAALTIGEERASRMDACRGALDNGVAMTIHSDAPVTPLGPLFTAWCAVNRQTMTGRTLGPAQRISVHEALHAITLGAAYTLKLDAEIGSVEVGKHADFAVLGEDPTAIAPESPARRAGAGHGDGRKGASACERHPPAHDCDRRLSGRRKDHADQPPAAGPARAAADGDGQ